MDGEAPYRRIVAELRSRITSGELRPGDPVPSTRRITRDWNVAMATATKVIAALRDEGLVDTKPGAGTVVRATGTRTAKGPDLGRERIVAAAVAVADAEGLGTLSMRRVATDLGVATMSLYRHVPGKDELLLLMVDAVFGELPFPTVSPSGWRRRLEVAARHMWTVFRRHPWAAEVLSVTRPQVMPNLLVYAEWTLATLRELGFGLVDMMHIHLSLFGHVRGLALSLQSEVHARQDTGMTNEEWIETQGAGMDAVLATGRYPTLEHVFGLEFDFDLDAVFEYGVQRLLDGVEVRLRALRRG